MLNNMTLSKSNSLLMKTLLLFRNEYIVFRVLIIMIHINLITPILIRMHTSHRTISGNFFERMISIELIHRE